MGSGRIIGGHWSLGIWSFEHSSQKIDLRLLVYRGLWGQVCRLSSR